MPLEEGAYEALDAGRKLLLFGLRFEERIDLLLENYAELERKILDLALRQAVFRGDEDLQRSRNAINRYLSNLMSSGRLYVDQTKHSLSDMFGSESQEYGALNDALRHEYESSLGYRVLEALRNYTQHRAFATHSISFSASAEEPKPGTRIKNQVSFALMPKHLREEGGFKSSVLNELEQAQNKKGLVELIPLIKEYVSGLARAHKATQAAVNPKLEESDQLLRETLDRVEHETNIRKKYVRAFRTVTARRIERIIIDERFTTERRRYSQKNRQADSVARQYVSSE